mmetsp:Transcript_77264/g.240050  ORF Transcript_77264/g.240050 Transcript_77264/m.240050 type:complete len:174 (+) Transcript_77264:854-1375(+)
MHRVWLVGPEKSRTAGLDVQVEFDRDEPATEDGVDTQVLRRSSRRRTRPTPLSPLADASEVCGEGGAGSVGHMVTERLLRRGRGRPTSSGVLEGGDGYPPDSSQATIGHRPLSAEPGQAVGRGDNPVDLDSSLRLSRLMVFGPAREGSRTGSPKGEPPRANGRRLRRRSLWSL